MQIGESDWFSAAAIRRVPRSFEHLVFKGDAFGVVLREPRFCGVHICKDLKVVSIADLLLVLT